MKKTISKIIAVPAFIMLLGESDDINVMLIKTIICGGILLFLCHINGAFREPRQDTE